jgi:hypothetical protein
VEACLLFRIHVLVTNGPFVSTENSEFLVVQLVQGQFVRYEKNEGRTLEEEMSRPFGNREQEGGELGLPRQVVVKKNGHRRSHGVQKKGIVGNQPRRNSEKRPSFDSAGRVETNSGGRFRHGGPSTSEGVLVALVGILFGRT